MASQAKKILEGDTENTMSFKKEMGVVTNITKSSSYSASNCCNNSSSHSISCMSEAERHARERDVMTVVMIGLVATDIVDPFKQR